MGPAPRPGLSGWLSPLACLPPEVRPQSAVILRQQLLAAPAVADCRSLSLRVAALPCAGLAGFSSHARCSFHLSFDPIECLSLMPSFPTCVCCVCGCLLRDEIYYLLLVVWGPSCPCRVRPASVLVCCLVPPLPLSSHSARLCPSTLPALPPPRAPLWAVPPARPSPMHTPSFQRDLLLLCALATPVHSPRIPQPCSSCPAYSYPTP